MKYISIVLAIVALVFVAVLYGKSDGNKVAYLKNSELYNQFDLKKELEIKLNNVKNQRKTILDSLMIPLKMLSEKLAIEGEKNQKEMTSFQIRKQQYIEKKKEFEEDSQRLADQYSQQIWKQINQYVKEYGKENDYSFIYGAAGDGSLMYAEDKYDITKELSDYLNSKYKGETK